MKTDLKSISIDKLIAELEIRKVEEIETKNKEFICIGIINNKGVESLVKVLNLNKFTQTLVNLKLRARFNTHRDPIVYAVKISEILFIELNERMKVGEYEEVTEFLKELSTFEDLGF